MGLDAEAAKRGLKAMEEANRTTAEKVKYAWKDIGNRISGFIGFGAFLEGLDKAFERVKQIQSGAAKTGLDTSTWQELSQIANEELPDGAEKFDAAITKLNVNIGEGAKNFEKWGINSRDAASAVFEIADKMQAMTDPAERAAMAVDLMGRGGAALVPMLVQGAAALHQMASEKSIFTPDDLENISKAHKQVEDMENRVTIWAGKFISAIADGAKFIGALSVPGGLAGNAAADAKAEMAAESARFDKQLAGYIGTGNFNSKTITTAPADDKHLNELDKRNEERLKKMQTPTARIADATREIAEYKKQIDSLDIHAADSASKRYALELKISNLEDDITQAKKDQQTIDNTNTSKTKQTTIVDQKIESENSVYPSLQKVAKGKGRFASAAQALIDDQKKQENDRQYAEGYFYEDTGNINGQDMHPGIQRFKSRADILTDDTARVGKDKSYLEDNGVIAKTVTDAVVAALANHSGGLPVKVVGTD